MQAHSFIRIHTMWNFTLSCISQDDDDDDINHCAIKELKAKQIAFACK